MNIFSYSYGVMLCVSLGAISIFVSPYLPFGSIVISIILGIIVGNFLKFNKIFKKGVGFSEKYFLSLAIAFMGVNLDLLILKETGLKSIVLVIIALVITILSALILGRIFNLDKKFALLLGIGSGVCGSSAIAATQQIIQADREKVGLSVAVINFLGTIGIFLIPFIAKIFLHFTDINSGILIGNTLQAVGQVVAAGFTISNLAGQTATIIKMTRILMLLPLVLILIFIFKNNNEPVNKNIKKPSIPIFIVGFILFSLLASLNGYYFLNLSLARHK